MTSNGTSAAFPFVADVAFQAGDIVFATDQSGCVVYWNKEAEAISGYKTEEVLRKPYTLACRMKPEVTGLDLPAIIAGRDFAGAVRCHSRSGGEAVLYLFATAGRNPAGKPAGVVFVGRDVTGLWQAEEVAQVCADKYRVLFENTLDAVAIATIDGKVLEANPACLRLYGYVIGDVKGIDLTNMVAPEDRGGAAAAMASLAADRPVAKTIRMRRKDGTRFVVDLVASVVVVGGERQIMWVTRDVTDRVRAEKARSQSERMYRTVFESANDAVFIESVDGHILDVNRNCCGLLGYGKDELVRKSVSDLVPPDARAWLPRVTDAILRDGTFRTEAVRVQKSGRRIPVDISASTMELDGGTAILSIVRDITERKLAEQALRESEEKFRNVSEQSPNMIFINQQGRVAYANRKCADVMGYTREEFYAPGFDFMRLIAPESAERIRAAFARHAQSEDVEPYEYSLVTKHGRRLESIITTRLIEYEGTKAILGIVTDITERVRADRALREEKERSQTYLALAGAMLVAIDAAGSITLLNRRACQVLGVAETEALGRNWFDNYVPERSRAQVRATFASLMQGNLDPVEYYENPVLTASGEERLIVWHNSLLRDRQGRPTGTLSSGEDVTEREQAVNALRESEENFRALAENATDGVIIGDERGRHLFANRRAAEMLGYSVGQLLEITFREFLPPGDRQMLEERFDRRLRGEDVPSRYEIAVTRRDGSVASVEVGVSQTKWHGRPAQMVMLHDISERKRVQQALSVSEERYRNLVETSPDGIAVYQDGVIVLANRTSARLLGYDDGADLVGLRAESLVSPDDRPRVEEHEVLLRSGGDITGPLTVTFLNRQGDSIPAEVVGANTTWHGKPAVQIMARPLSARPG